MWLRSGLLMKEGFPLHGFTIREGGVSQGEFSSLNFSTSTGDKEECIEENYRLLANALGVGRELFRGVKQIHGDRVVELDDPMQATTHEEADALLAWSSEVVVGVKTADCVPILLAERRSRAVAAVHAGWRGVVGKIALAAIERMQARLRQAEILVVIGPHIGADAFQVGEEVASKLPAFSRPDPSEKTRFLVDLRAAVEAQIREVGVPASSIDHVEGCTVSDPLQRFFSHRKSGGRCGRMFNFIAGKKP